MGGPSQHLRGWEAQSCHRAPGPGGIWFRRRRVPSWQKQSSTIPPQTAGAARDIAAVGVSAGRDSCSTSPSIRLSTPRGDRRTRRWVHPVRSFPGAAASQAVKSRPHQASAATSRSRTAPDRSGKLRRIADSSWATIRTTILDDNTSVESRVGRSLRNNRANILSEYPSLAPAAYNREPGDRNPNLFSYYLGGIAVLRSRYRQFRDTSIARSR
jgi:hypothetical protein